MTWVWVLCTELCVCCVLVCATRMCSGYGMSEGRPSERRMYSDANCAWEALRSRCGVRPEQVVLYGQSIGTVPTVDLAARVPCAGVVLHSPLTSGIRVACSGTRRTWCCDSFARYADCSSCKILYMISILLQLRPPQRLRLAASLDA